MYITPILCYNFVELIILWYIFLVILFTGYKEYVVSKFLLSKFSEVLPAFTCARDIGNHWSNYFGVNILNLPPSTVLYLASNIIEESIEK